MSTSGPQENQRQPKESENASDEIGRSLPPKFSHSIFAPPWNFWNVPIPVDSISLPFQIHPGHILLAISTPFCIHAYRGFKKPLEPFVQKILVVPVLVQATSPAAMATATSSTTEASATAALTLAKEIMQHDLKFAEESVRRSIGSAVALRALVVATSGCIGAFGLTLALIFTASGCTTLDQAMTRTRNWAHNGRRRLDVWFGIQNRVDCNHPEYLLTRDMTEEQEMEHVSNVYFPQEDWEAEK